MKKGIYLLLLVVCAAFIGCKKESKDGAASVNYATLYSVLGKSVSSATSTIKKMGYTYAIDEGGESGSCLFFAANPETTPSAAMDHIVIVYSGGQVSSAYHSSIKSGNQTKTTIDYIKNAGEVLKINGDKLPFFMGVTDDNEDMSDYNDFVATLPYAQNEVSALWRSATLNRMVQYYCDYDKKDDLSELHFACFNSAIED